MFEEPRIESSVVLRLRSGRLYGKFISETRLANAGAADRGRPVRYLTRRKRRVDIYATHFHRLQEPEHRRTAGAALQVNSHACRSQTYSYSDSTLCQSKTPLYVNSNCGLRAVPPRSACGGATRPWPCHSAGVPLKPRLLVLSPSSGRVVCHSHHQVAHAEQRREPPRVPVHDHNR